MSEKLKMLKLRSLCLFVNLKLVNSCETGWTKLKLGNEFNCYKRIPVSSVTVENAEHRCALLDAFLPLPRSKAYKIGFDYKL